jgi:CheY-like chemotaxis protein
MTSSTKSVIDVESRRDARAPLLATAELSREGETLGRFTVVNLSAGGALLAGQLDLPLGATMEITLRLPWTPAIRTEVRLVRLQRDNEGAAFAVAFCALPIHDGDVIHSAVVHLLKKARTARVLVVTGQEIDACHSFVLAIEELGCPAIVVTTASEALRLLATAGSIRVVIVDEKLRGENAKGFLAHLAKRHPRLRRVLSSDAAPEGNPCQQIGVHAMLTQPCTAPALTAALALSPAARPRLPADS